MMLIHSSCKAVKGAGSPIRTDTNTQITEAIFTVSWKLMNRLKFS